MWLRENCNVQIVQLWRSGVFASSTTALTCINTSPSPPRRGSFWLPPKTHCSQVFSLSFLKQEYLFLHPCVFVRHHIGASDLIVVLFLLCSWQDQSRASNCLWQKIPTTDGLERFDCPFSQECKWSGRVIICPQFCSTRPMIHRYMMAYILFIINHQTHAMHVHVGNTNIGHTRKNMICNALIIGILNIHKMF